MYKKLLHKSQLTTPMAAEKDALGKSAGQYEIQLNICLGHLVINIILRFFGTMSIVFPQQEQKD